MPPEGGQPVATDGTGCDGLFAAAARFTVQPGIREWRGLTVSNNTFNLAVFLGGTAFGLLLLIRWWTVRVQIVPRAIDTNLHNVSSLIAPVTRYALGLIAASWMAVRLLYSLFFEVDWQWSEDLWRRIGYPDDLISSIEWKMVAAGYCAVGLFVGLSLVCLVQILTRAPRPIAPKVMVLVIGAPIAFFLIFLVRDHPASAMLWQILLGIICLVLFEFIRILSIVGIVRESAMNGFVNRIFLVLLGVFLMSFGAFPVPWRHDLTLWDKIWPFLLGFCLTAYQAGKIVAYVRHGRIVDIGAGSLSNARSLRPPTSN